MIEHPSDGKNTAEVSLSIPCRAEYVGVARLAILGVASRMNFSYDEVEDLRLAVGEACTGAIDRSNHAGQMESTIRISCLIDNDDLTVVVKDDVHNTAADTPPNPDDVDNIGGLLMEILVDSVDTIAEPGTGTTVTLKKKAQIHDQAIG